MTKAFYICLQLFLTQLWGSVLWAKDQSLSRLVVDKGYLTVSSMAIQRPYELVYKFPNDCAGSRLEASFVDGELIIKHVGTFCPSGAQINIFLPTSIKRADVHLGNGMLMLEGKLYERVEDLKVWVLTGGVQSEKEKVTRDPQEAGVIFSRSKKGSLTLKVTVNAGVVRF